MFDVHVFQGCNCLLGYKGFSELTSELYEQTMGFYSHLLKSDLQSTFLNWDHFFHGLMSQRPRVQDLCCFRPYRVWNSQM